MVNHEAGEIRRILITRSLTWGEKWIARRRGIRGFFHLNDVECKKEIPRMQLKPPAQVVRAV